MLTLYMKPTCPFSKKVMAVAADLGIELELKDIKNNDEFAAELIDKGGKKQVPYLVDSDKGEAMYESDKIIGYLEKTYGGGGKVRVHQSNDTCPN